jgi:hypothetical protein
MPCATMIAMQLPERQPAAPTLGLTVRALGCALAPPIEPLVPRPAQRPLYQLLVTPPIALSATGRPPAAHPMALMRDW